MEENFFQNVNLTVLRLEDLRRVIGELVAEVTQKKQQQPEEQYLTVNQACEQLHVSKPTLWRWEKLNYLIPNRVGRQRLYKASDIARLRAGKEACDDA